MCQGFMYGSVQLWPRPLPRELDHPITLGIGGIGRDTVSEGVNKVKTLLREIVSRFCPRYRGWAMACGPDTSSEIVGREAGATHMLLIDGGLYQETALRRARDGIAV
jgi:hypothetical protein